MADINQVQLPDGSQYNITDTTSGYATQSYVQSAISGITKATIGLGNVDNTSDANKPVSTAQQTALDGKTDTSVIAYTETSTTATKRYEIGDQFILNGVLYTATAIIANGGTITVGTNCTASDTIVEQIPNVGLKADKSDLTSISETGSTASQAISAGTYFYLNGTLVRAKTAIANGATFTLNTNYEVVADGALNKTIKYFSEEHIIGNWIDGSILYEKTIDCGALPNNTTKNVAHNISNLKNVISVNGIGIGSTCIPLPWISSTNQCTIYVRGTNVVIVDNDNLSSYNGYVTLRYTKTS